MRLSEIIKMLASESSTRFKSKILADHAERTDLKLYFMFTLDPFINFYMRVKSLPPSGTQELSVDIMQKLVDKLNGRQITGNAARDYVDGVLGLLAEPDQLLLKNMIDRDACCNVAQALVNKCWKDLVPVFPVMLCEDFDAKTSGNVPEGDNAIVVQKKEDGGRIVIVVDQTSKVTVYSRNGKVLELFGLFDDHFKQYPSQVFDGELVAFKNNVPLERKISNGLFNKAVRGTISLEEAQLFVAILWDTISMSDWQAGYSSVPYAKRLFDLEKVIDQTATGYVRLVETELCSTHERAMEIYDNFVAAGCEGIVVKPVTAPWEAVRSKYALKMKEVLDCSLRCESIEPHSKNSNLIGSLVCVSECKQIRTSIGTGLSDSDRKQPPEYFVGKILDVQYNALITSKATQTYSLYLPRYKGIRLDQDHADVLGKLKKP